MCRYMHNNDITLYQWFGILLVTGKLQRSKCLHRNAIVKLKHVKLLFLSLSTSYISVIGSESESVCCYIRYMLKMCPSMLKIRLKYLKKKKCDFSAFLTKLIEFYHFLGRLLFVFQAEKMLLNVWLLIGVCVFNRP